MVAQYSGAQWLAAAPGNYRVPASPRGVQDIDLIVVHITDGGATRAEQTARWFANGNQHNLRGKEIHVSAHYVVGREGDVFQCVRHENIAQHAGRANPRSIGIEHVVPHSMSSLTQEQYDDSAKLIRWLCGLLRIPPNSRHIKGHAEADTRTSHTSCPNKAFDWTELWARLSLPGDSFENMIADLARP